MTCALDAEGEQTKEGVAREGNQRRLLGGFLIEQRWKS